ncbi:MAG: hypothetical protein FWG68_01120 [Defluviitaleaceae bacterium]|nr:hypothetical protein [Defluviitaleaceae bacterium]
MAFEIINCNVEQFPPLRLIGKKYTHADRVNGSFAAVWQECFADGWLERLEDIASLRRLTRLKRVAWA